MKMAMYFMKSNYYLKEKVKGTDSYCYYVIKKKSM